MFIVTDASLWIARLVSEDVFYQPVKDWMATRRVADDQFLAPSLLLAEIGGAIRRRTTRGADSTYVAITLRLDLPLITLNADQRQKAAKRVKVLSV